MNYFVLMITFKGRWSFYTILGDVWRKLCWSFHVNLSITVSAQKKPEMAFLTMHIHRRLTITGPFNNSLKVFSIEQDVALPVHYERKAGMTGSHGMAQPYTLRIEWTEFWVFLSAFACFLFYSYALSSLTKKPCSISSTCFCSFIDSWEIVFIAPACNMYIHTVPCDSTLQCMSFGITIMYIMCVCFCVANIHWTNTIKIYPQFEKGRGLLHQVSSTNCILPLPSWVVLRESNCQV